MTSHPGVRPTVNRRPLLWIAIACFAVGVVVSGILMSRLSTVMPHEPVPLGDGMIQLNHDGLTISTTEPGQTPTCQAKDATGTDIPLKPPLKRENYSVRGPSYYVIAHSKSAIPPQTVTVTCTNTDNTIPYYVGNRAAVDTMFPIIARALGALALASLIGIPLIIIDVTRRRRAR